MLKELDTVTVTVDLPEHGLQSGDVGAVVHCYPNADTYEVDFVDDEGRPRGTVTLAGSCLLRLNLRGLASTTP